jgi:hypothetical protein
MLNAILTLVSLNVFIWTRLTDLALQIRLSVTCSLLLAIFAWASWYAWRSLTRNQYRKARQQAAFLQTLESMTDQEASQT